MPPPIAFEINYQLRRVHEKVRSQPDLDEAALVVFGVRLDVSSSSNVQGAYAQPSRRGHLKKGKFMYAKGDRG